MAGAFRMALSRATVTIRDPDGQVLAVHKPATATLRDGVARAKIGSTEVATMAATELHRLSGKHYTVTAADGTTWDVLRDCGCR